MSSSGCAANTTTTSYYWGNDKYGCWSLSFAVVAEGWTESSFPVNVEVRLVCLKFCDGHLNVDLFHGTFTHLHLFEHSFSNYFSGTTHIT